jgi:dipeptidase
MKVRHLTVLLAVVVLGLLLVQGVAAACTTIIVGKDLTPDGSVLIAHNEEDSGTIVQHYAVTPAGTGGPYELWSTGSVDVPSPSAKYIGSWVYDKAAIPGDFIGGVNQYQVAIYNNMAYSHEYPEDPWAVNPGGVIWTEFNLLATMQAKSAREAVETMGLLSETRGLSCDPGTMFGIADPKEGWFIEIARGGQWVAQRVGDGEAAMQANCFRIGEVDFGDTDHSDFMWSSNLIGFAEDKGWYDSESGTVFNWANVYGEAASLTNPSNVVREIMVQRYLDASAPVTPKTLMSILSSHYEGTMYDKSDGYAKTPHSTGVRTECRTSTQVSEVTQLRGWLPADIGAVVWMSMKTPCSSIYLPWYLGITKVPAAYTVGTDTVKEGSAWWAFEDLISYVNDNYKATIGTVKGVWAPIQAKLLKDQKAFEKDVLKLWKTNKTAARAKLTAYCSKWGTAAYKDAQTLLVQLKAGK